MAIFLFSDRCRKRKNCELPTLEYFTWKTLYSSCRAARQLLYSVSTFLTFRQLNCGLVQISCPDIKYCFRVIGGE